LFTELVPLLAGGRALMLTVTQPDPDHLTVVVQPMTLKEGENPALSVPLHVTATPEQLDTEFPDALRGFAAQHRSVADSLAESTRRMKEAATAKDNRKQGGPARPGSQVRQVPAAPPAPPPAPAIPTLWDETPPPPEPEAAAGAAPAAETEAAAAPPAAAAPEHEAAQPEEVDAAIALQEVA
jgi:PRTRC genetic system protein E